MNLYEIDQEIMNCVDMETGEIIDPARLDELQMDRDTKIENIACWIKNLNADAEAFKAEKQSFADRQKTAENKAESLKMYLANYLAGQKFSTPKVAISFRKTSSVSISDLSLIPKEYLKYEDPKPKKDEIKKAINSGKCIKGAELVTAQSISIK